MPTPTKGARLGGSPSHERLILANLATSLFRHGRITTTDAKARRLRPFAERLITKAKRGDLHARRQVLTVVRDRDISTALFDEIGPRYANRAGGYTRIVKTTPRRGDAAPMAIIELVEPLVEAEQAPRRPARKASKEESVAALAGEPADGTLAAGAEAPEASGSDAGAPGDEPERTEPEQTDKA